MPPPSPSNPSNPGRITQREIAKAAGLHFSTVSLALRDSPLLPSATKEKVKQIAKNLQYQPDPVLSALNDYRTAKAAPHYQSTIAWVNNWPTRGDLLKTPAFNEYFLSASQRGAELGYKLEEFWMAEPGISKKRAVSILRARNVKGLLLAPQPRARTLLPLDYNQFSVLAFGFSLAPANFHIVTSDQYQCINLMLQKLDQLNYRRIGVLLTKDWDDKVNNSYLSGMLVSNNKHLIKAKVFPHIIDNFQQKDFNSWLKKCSLDVVVSLSLLGEIAGWLRALGLKIPADIGLASLDVGSHEKHLAGVNQNNVVIGRTAMEYLVNMLKRGERGVPEVPLHILAGNTWVPGETLRPQNPAK